MHDQHSRPLTEGPRVFLRPFALADGPEFSARARESEDLHRLGRR